MQTQKTDMRNAILSAAKLAFARRGFQKASMREIAESAGIRVGNIYNYFSGKDDLFRAVVVPAIAALDSLFYNAHFFADRETEKSGRADDEAHKLIFHNNRVAMKILLFGAQGSSLENFKRDFIGRVADALHERVGKEPTLERINRFTIHLLCVWHFTLIEEMLTQNVNASEIKQIICDWKRAEELLAIFKNGNL